MTLTRRRERRWLRWRNREARNRQWIAAFERTLAECDGYGVAAERISALEMRDSYLASVEDWQPGLERWYAASRNLPGAFGQGLAAMETPW